MTARRFLPLYLALSSKFKQKQQHFLARVRNKFKGLIIKELNSHAMKPEKGGYWKSRKEKLLKMYESLSQKDLDYKEGEENAMLATLGNKLGKSREELLKMIIML
jgi:hypothetical protein